MSMIDQIIEAIHKVETRGMGATAKYNAVGKPNSKGQRAYGKYQVMDFNIPSWTKQYLGKPLTVEQFRNNPQAQEAVARGRMTDLYNQYQNAADVASIWFTGRPVAKVDPNVKDSTGTTASKYVNMVLAELGHPQQQQQVAQNPQKGGGGVAGSIKNMWQNLTGTNPALAYARVSDGPRATSTPPKPFTPLNFSKLWNNKDPEPKAQAPLQIPYLKKFGEQRLGKVTTPFGGQTSQEAIHPGVDIAGRMGTPIPSTTGGVVVGSDNGHVQGENNYGNSVLVKDPEGNTHRYSHLKKSYVPKGTKVRPGQVIGEMGNTGAAYSASGLGDGTNLDYRIVTAYGQYKNPMTYLKNLI